MSEFQNAEGISVPLEILGENVPKPESNSMSGLPLTPDPNQPVPTTAGKDLPAPTLSPENGGNQGTLLQPDPLPGQDQTPPPENQNPPADPQPPAGENTPMDGQTPVESASPTEAGTPSETQSAVDSAVSSTEPTPTTGPEDVKTGEPVGESQTGGAADTAGVDGTVNQLRPDDIVDLLNSAPPKRVMRREEVEAWLSIEDRIVARRKAERRSNGFQGRRLRRRRAVF